MERITERYTDAYGITRAGLKVASHGEACNHCEDYACEQCSLHLAVQKLAALEDIMGDDYNLERLRKLVEDDRAGAT